MAFKRPELKSAVAVLAVTGTLAAALYPIAFKPYVYGVDEQARAKAREGLTTKPMSKGSMWSEIDKEMKTTEHLRELVEEEKEHLK